MTNDIVALIEYYEKEKGIDRDKVVAALEFAFISAYRKMVPGAEAIETLRADVNTRKGETRIFASLKAVPDEEYQDKFNEVPLSTALKKMPDAQAGDASATIRVASKGKVFFMGFSKGLKRGIKKPVRWRWPPGARWGPPAACRGTTP